MVAELIQAVRDAGDLAQIPLQALGSQFGDSTAQWLYRLARGCDTEEVSTAITIVNSTAALLPLCLISWAVIQCCMCVGNGSEPGYIVGYG